LEVFLLERAERFGAGAPQDCVGTDNCQAEKRGKFNMHDVLGEEAEAASHRPGTCPPIGRSFAKPPPFLDVDRLRSLLLGVT
jgi:hypothetical protein